MTPSDLRADVPALSDTTYMNTGASGPSPTRVVRAAEDALEHHEFDAPGAEGMYTAASDTLDGAREAAASVLGADPEDVALTHSTTDGINRVATALDWSPGDTVVRTDLEHPAGVLPWAHLRERRGVEVSVLETERGRVSLDDVNRAAADADLFCVSAVTWTHGTRLPVADIVDVAHDAGARVLVDAVQAPGQMSVDATEWGADFVAAAAHKWLLGPWGAGFLYVAPDVDVAPAQVGYASVTDPGAEGVAFHEGARRFEVGTVSPAPYAGLTEAVRLHEELGPDAVESRIADLADRLKAGLDDRLVSPPDARSGLVSFAADDPDALVERLADEESIVVRSLPTGAVRASLHAFNTAGEVDALLDAV